MRLKGSIRVEFLDRKTLKPTREPYEQENLIPDNTYELILGLVPSPIGFTPGSGSTKISISTSTTVPSANNHTLTDIIATGYVPAGVTSPKWYESVEPNFGEIQNRIDPLTTPRDFDTIGLTNLATNSNQPNLSTTTYAYTLLNTTCTQEAFEVLNIFYRITFLNTKGERLTPRFVRDLGGQFFNIKDCRHYFLGTTPFDPPVQLYIDPYFGGESELINTLFIGTPFTNRWDNSVGAIANHFKWKESKLFQIQQSGIPGHTDMYIGKIFNSLLTGLSNDNLPNPTTAGFIGGSYTENVSAAYRISRINESNNPAVTGRPVFEPPFQKIWTHRENAPLPFFDSLNTATGTGALAIAGIWTGGFPELYRYTIVTGGEVGVATYKLAVRKHLGFVGNSYTDELVNTPFRNPNTPAAEGQHGYQERYNDLLRWSDTQIVQYDETGVTILDLMDGSWSSWDSTTSPSLNVTNLKQCAVDTTNDLIYCACRNTGLHVIDVGAATITTLLATRCYGVDVGRNNIAFAIFDGSLRNSNDWGIPLTFTFTGLTDGNWSRAYYLKADPEHADDHVAVVADTGSSSQRVIWWDAVSTSTVAGYTSTSVPTFTAGLDVSDTGGFWAFNSFRLNFGTSGVNSIASVPGKNVDGSFIYKISFYEDNPYLFTTAALVDSNNTAIASYTNLTSNIRPTLVHITGGILCLGTTMRQAFTDNVYCWDEYGWNGANWELGNTNAKTTHAAAEATINGLTIAWSNGATPPSFVATDFYTQGICNGYWKDNGTSVYVENYWYSRPVRFDVAIPGGTTIPGGAPYELVFPLSPDPEFYRLETDSASTLTNFEIAGVPVPTVYNDGTPPGLGEVTVAADRITFNSGDAGKAFTGTYAWIGF